MTVSSGEEKIGMEGEKVDRHYGQSGATLEEGRRFKTPGIPCYEWEDYCLRQMFDPSYIDHLPVKEQLRYYKHRDLSKSKLYNMARRVWGDRHLGSRWRQMESSGGGSNDRTNQMLANEVNKDLEDHQKSKRLPNYPPAKGTESTVAGRTLLWNDDEDFPDMKSSEFYVPRNKRQPLAPIQKKPTNEEPVMEMAATNQIQALKLQANIEELRERKQKEDEYRVWVEERMKLREGLDRMDDLERWLSSKPVISPLEAAVLKRFLEWKFEMEERKRKKTPVVRTPSSSTTVPPEIDRPLPIMIAILEAYLQEHKLRLLDYFTMTDKPKHWNIGRDEMRKIIAWTKLPVTDAELDDFIQYLDRKGDGYLEYKDIARSRQRFLVEERQAILREYGGEIGTVLAEQKKMRAQAEKEAERMRTAEEQRNRRREASFVAYEGDQKLYKVHYGDPRKPPIPKKIARSKTRDSSGNSKASNPMARRRKDTIAMRRKIVEKKASSAPPEGRSASNIRTSRGQDERCSESDQIDEEVNSIEEAAEEVKREKAKRGKSAVTWSEREWTPVQIERFRELGPRRVVDILTSRSPSAPPSEPDIPDDRDSPFIRTPTPLESSEEKQPRNPLSRAASADRAYSSGRQSVATTLLQTPPIDTSESIDFDQEIFFDKAKRLQYHTRISRDRQRDPNMLEVVPLMVKCGDKEIDDHLTFCTRWQPLDIHQKRQKFRQQTWMEYEKCMELCEKKGIPLTEKTLKRALLHPADVRITKHHKLRVPGTHPTDQPYKKPKKIQTEDENDEEGDLELMTVANITNALFAFAKNFKDKPKPTDEDDDDLSTASSDLDSIDYKVFKPKAKNASNPACLYPKHKPPKDKEPMKLSTGPAFISSKVDNWMSYKDFLRFSRNQKHHVTSYFGFYDESKMWPGTTYKTRMPENTRVKPSDSVFQQKPKISPQYKGKTTIFNHLVK